MTIQRINADSKPVKLPKPCKYCKGLGHLAFGCRKRPKKPMNKTGRISKLNAKVGRQFKKENPPNHEGYYECYYCKRWVPPELMNPEHTDSKARHPEERTNQKKLVIACTPCNEAKGSLSAEEYIERLKKEKNG